MSYNGYTNYETWNVCLWISNDEGLYNLSRRCADYADFICELRDMGIVETNDMVAWNDSGINVREVNDACFNEEADDVIEDDTAVA